MPDIDQIRNLEDHTTFTPQDAARLLGMSPNGIRQNIKRGKIKAVKILGRIFITAKELKNLIKE
jgi:excisionase family DNA binding protein